jgi:NAD(P)-dependent dehydrogenase (short-subunit alcohol dehydrogenase family)/acyl dehydratase
LAMLEVISGSTFDRPSVSFTEEDVAVFSDASGDRNPLHLNHDYARSTAYGQPVLFGCLGAMACLGHIHLPAGWCAKSLEAEFGRPMFLGVAYRIETSQKDGKWRARLFDGSAVVVSVTVTAELSHGNEMLEEIAAAYAFERRDAAVRQEADIVPGLEVSGVYACNRVALAALASRWRVDRFLAKLLCWSSYLVGMELPGESALFSRLVLHFRQTDPCPAMMAYRASVASVDSRFGQVVMNVSLLNGDSALASGQLCSFIRPPVPEVEEIDSTGVKRSSLAGRVAVLLGSSRGLGAAMKQALELRGATVYGMARSANAGERSRTEVGDAADPEALRRLRERVLREHGRLDFLICNACPPVLPLRLEANAVERIGAYIHLAVSLTLAPLSEFLELLNRSDGCAVIISSFYVEQPVKEFPHYIAAKQAVEMLGQVASLQYRRVRTLIVRPEKLLTAMTNTPLGRLDAASPALIANRVAARLEDPPQAGTTEIIG